MARKISMRQALNEALDQEMARDPRVIVMGEDIVGGAGGAGERDAWGGVMGVTKGLYAKYGERLMDTPLSESAYIGAAIGAAACGMRPVAELMFIDFMGVCFDEIFNQAAKFKYMFGGKAETPVVIRAMVGAGFRAAAQHSQMLTPLFTHIPGLKVVCPSNAYDAKGLLIQSIRDNDPVIFCEHKNLYGHESEVPAESYAIPFAEANVVREGKDATIVTYGQMVHPSRHGCGRDARQEEDRMRGHRSAHPLAHRHGYGHRQRREHGPPGLRRRGPSALLHRQRCRGQGGAGGLQIAEGRHPDGDRAPYAGALLAVAGGYLRADRSADRSGRREDHGALAPGSAERSFHRGMP